MLTIECPHCKRGLRAPEERGDHRVVCPGCTVAFTVVSDAGMVRVLSTSVYEELPLKSPNEAPVSIIEADDPPGWIPVVAVNVENDEAARRTRRIQYTYLIASLVLFAIFVHEFASEREGLSAEKIVMSAFIALFMSVFVTVFVGYFLLPAPADPHRKRDQALRGMSKALRGGDSAPDDGEANRPSPPADPSSTDVSPKDPPD